MPKAPRHRKRVRTARLEATSAPLGGHADAAVNESVVGEANGASGKAKKVGKKEAEVTHLIEKLRSDKSEERVWAATALSGMVTDLPAVTLRLLLSKNLIGLLIERLNDEEDSVVVESLGTLRNLAITQPASLLSEMFNKRLLHPITSRLIPLLASLLPAQLQPFSPPALALPASPEDQKAHQLTTAKADLRRKLFWDWCENVLVLLSCLAESNTKILNALNAVKSEVVGFCAAFLDTERMGFGAVEEGKGKKRGLRENKKERVPLQVAVAAAQTLHSFLSSNPPARTHLVASIPSLLQLLSTASLPLPSPTSEDLDDFAMLRVLSFGILLSMKLKRKEERDVLEAQVGVLTSLLETDLEAIGKEAEECVSRVGVEAPQNPQLVRIEKKLSTLQLALEILGEWCTSLDLAGAPAPRKRPQNDSEVIDDDEEPEDNEEEWGGIMGEQGDFEMNDDDDSEDAEDEEDAAMDEGDATPAVRNFARLELSSDVQALCHALPSILLRLSTFTSCSFLSLPSSNSATDPKLISTTPSSVPVSTLLAPLHPVSETITTIHVRSLECLNNLLITIAKSPSPSALVDLRVLQAIWEQVLARVLKAAEGGLEGAEELVERRKELVGAGVGVAWGVSRIGLDDGLVVGAPTTPFLIQLFSHPFATEASPAGEAVRVRIAGMMGCIGSRASISVEENLALGNLLLSVLPAGKNPSPLAPTPDVLIQAIDSIIDIYADEEALYDEAAFKGGQFLPRLDGAVAGVRAATKKIDRKKFPELRARADGALENLVAFVQYRKDVD